MKFTAWAALLFAAFLPLISCVQARTYRKELAARSAAEAREKVLVQELLDRKRETSQLTKTTENLARDLGKQDAEIADLKELINSTKRSMGESATQLASEKTALEKRLATAQSSLEQRESTIQKIKSVQDRRKSVLASLESELVRAYFPFSSAGVTAVTDGEAIMLTLPDAALFDAGGVNVSAKGKDLLRPLAEFLASRPSLSVDVLAYTDNVLPPKEKTLKDTWEWSAARAANVVRLLIRDYNVNANQMTPIAKGEFYPITSNESAEGRQKNRRTVIQLRPVLPALPAAE